MEQSSPSIAGVCTGWAEQMGAYRFLASPMVTLLSLLTPHRRQTLRRIQEEPIVLLPQDTTELDYEGKPIAHTPGQVGPLNTQRRVGVQAHLQYAVTPDHRPF